MGPSSSESLSTLKLTKLCHLRKFILDWKDTTWITTANKPNKIPPELHKGLFLACLIISCLTSLRLTRDLAFTHWRREEFASCFHNSPKPQLERSSEENKRMNKNINHYGCIDKSICIVQICHMFYIFLPSLLTQLLLPVFTLSWEVDGLWKSWCLGLSLSRIPPLDLN